MALDRLTKIDGGGISTTSDYRVGIITATKFVGPIEGTITSTDANFTGNVTIGGTLTYEDVTNIDSVGIITARDGIDCNGDLDVDGHTNLDNVSIVGVTTTTGNLNVTDGRILIAQSTAPQIRINSSTGDSSATRFLLGLATGSNNFINGAVANDACITAPQEVKFGIGNNLKFRISNNLIANTDVIPNGNNVRSLGLSNYRWSDLYSVDANISGDLDVDGHTNLDNVSVAGITTFSNNVHLLDNDNLYIGGSAGTTDGMRIFHNGSTSYITDNGTGDLVINSVDGNLQLRVNDTESAIKCLENGAVQLYYDNIERLRTYNEGVQVIGAEGGNAAILIKADEGDNNNDIYRIIAGNGTNLFFQNYATGSYVTNLKLTGDGNGAVELNYAGTKRLETTSSGISVTGSTVVSGDLDVDGHTNLDNVSIAGVTTITGMLNAAGNIGNVQFTGSYVNVDGNLDIADSIRHLQDSNTKIRFPANDAISLETGGSERFRVQDDKVMISVDFKPDADSSRDLGTNNNRFANGYFDTLYGDGSNLTGISGVTISGNADNRVITGGSGSNLNGESNLTFDGTSMVIGGGSAANVLDLGTATGNRGISWGGSSYNYTNIWSEYSGASLWLAAGLKSKGNSTGFFSSYGGSNFARSAIELESYSGGGIKFFTSGAQTVATDGAITVNERLRIDTSGRVKIGTISDHTIAATHSPVYIKMNTDITAVDTAEGAANTGLVRIEETGSNALRYHGIELRNRQSGDIRLLNLDVNSSNYGDFVLAMPSAATGGSGVGLALKLRFNSTSDAIQIAGKGGASLSNSNVEKTDIYIATKTGVTAVNTQAGDAVAGLIRFEDKGDSNNRYHGIELRNRNSGDVRILNLDEGATNKSNLVFATDNGSDVIERLRIHSSGLIEAATSYNNTYSSSTGITPHIRIRNQLGADNICGGIQLRADRNNGAASVFNIACLTTSTSYESPLVFQSRNSDGGFSEKLRITSDGVLQLALQGSTFRGRAYGSNNFEIRGTGTNNNLEIVANANQENVSDGDIVFKSSMTGGGLVEKMRIKASGQIVSATQPCFSVAMSSNYTSSSDHTGNFDTERFDQGNNFNTGSNGIFTAPVSGKYYMHAAIQTAAGGSSQVHIMGIAFLVNGSVDSSKGSGDQYLGRTGTEYITVHCIRILNLAANDTVQVRIQLHGTVSIEGQGGIDRCNWQGHLVA